MSKIRVYELAKELGMDNRDLIERMERLGIAVRSHSSTLEEDEVQRIRQEVALGEKNAVVEKRVRAGVIRRRAVRRAVEEEEREVTVPGEETEIPDEGGEELQAEPKIMAKPLPPKEEEIKAEPKPAQKKERKTQEAEIIGFVKKPLSGADVVRKEAKPEKKEEPQRPAKAKVPPAAPEEKKPEARKETKITSAKESVPPAGAVPAKARVETAVEKKKKQVETAGEERATRKKALVKQRAEKREKKVLRDRDAEIISRGRREEKKVAAPAMKKTEITTPKAIKRRVKVEEAIRVGDLAKRMGVKAREVIGKLMSLGIMVTINQSIDVDAATLVAGEFGYQVESVSAGYEEMVQRAVDSSNKLTPRAPVVTVMGHVDHGKTSLLDSIRKTNVIEGEAGGITQAIGAYHVSINGRDIVFLDTPGHEAFTSMRARGAQVTDIVILVVAADDGVMDQTVEAINHSRAAGVPIIVAINKIDKEGADPGRITQQLSEYGLVPEAWGGDTIFVEVSAKQELGIEELLELILLQADMMELKADATGSGKGVIIESKLDKGRGPVATVLMQEGTLREGDAFVSRTEYGKVRAMIDDKGLRVSAAVPSMPVEVIGFSKVPQAGSDVTVVEDERKARGIADYWLKKEREKELSKTSKITLEQLYEKIKEGVKEFNVILKADVQGSIEALSDALNKLSTDDVKVNVIHSSPGTVTETDVMLASASEAIIMGFMVRPDSRVSELAENEGVEIKFYDVIYNAIADVRAAMEGLLEPLYEEVYEGRAVVRELFKVPKIGIIAGSYITDGKVSRSSNIRLLREGVVIYNGTLMSLKRFKDDAKEVSQGFECGLGIEGFNDIKVDDVIESYTTKKVARKLE